MPPTPPAAPLRSSPVSAFPWRALPSVPRAEVEARRALRRAARGTGLEGGAVEEALGELARVPVSVRVRRVAPAEARAGADDSVGVVLAEAGERSPSRRMLVELEGALAAALVTRTLEHPPPRVTDAARPPAPAVAGATAAIVHAALRRALPASALVVLAAGPGAALGRDLLATTHAVTAWLTVSLGGETFGARITACEGLTTSARPLDRDDEGWLASLGGCPLPLRVVAATTLLARSELRALAPGDVLLPGGSLELRDGKLTGRVLLVAEQSERGLACDLADGERLVLRGEAADCPVIAPAREEPPMTSTPTAPTPTSAALEDAPVVLRVEIGTVEMTARAWSELSPGDVLTLGVRVGEAVVLRVGGVEVARGELVQVDGEVGVRIGVRSSARG